MNTETTRGGPAHVAVAMLGARRHYAVPEILHAAGRLDRFFTDIDASAPWLRTAAALVPPALRGNNLARLAARQATDIPRDRIVSFPFFGLRRALRSRLAKSPARRLNEYLDWNRKFGRLVCRNWPADANAFYVFNSAGVEILEECRRRGLSGIVDQTAAPWAVEEPLLAEERERWPGWEFEGSVRSDWEGLAARERREWDLADVIVCGSDYVRNGIQSVGGPAGKCAVVPYGVDHTAFRPRIRARSDGPLKVLFVGTIQLRKGIQYLAEVARALKKEDVLIRAVGAVRVSAAAERDLRSVIELAGAVPRTHLAQEYDRADVLVAPSISEGSANVCYEALASGLPVITTPNAGSVVRDGLDGFIVPIRSAPDLADRIGRLARDRVLLSDLSDSAIRRAAEFTWQTYKDRLIRAITIHE